MTFKKAGSWLQHRDKANLKQSYMKTSAFRKNAVIFLYDQLRVIRRGWRQRESRGSQTQAWHVDHQLLVHSHVKACRWQRGSFQCGLMHFQSIQILMENITRQLSLTEFYGIAQKLLHLELHIEVTKKYKQKWDLKKKKQQQQTAERPAVPVLSWLGQGPPSQMLIRAGWHDTLYSYMCCGKRIYLQE